MSTRPNVFEWRMRIWDETRRMAQTMPAPPSKKMRQSAEFPGEARGGSKGNITVVDGDSLECGRELLMRGLNPLVLNFADDVFAGGCVDSGSGAQEESIFRRTNICSTLLQDAFYPIADDEGVQSPEVTVFRDTEPNNNKFVEPWKVAIASVPGVRMPRLDGGGMTVRDLTRLRRKIMLILQMAVEHGHNAVVLGALGCGAWRCPPADVAEVFRDVLVTCDMKNMFEEVVFPCLRWCETGYITRNRRDGDDNQTVFTRVLSESAQ